MGRRLRWMAAGVALGVWGSRRAREAGPAAIGKGVGRVVGTGLARAVLGGETASRVQRAVTRAPGLHALGPEELEVVPARPLPALGGGALRERVNGIIAEGRRAAAGYGVSRRRSGAT